MQVISITMGETVSDKLKFERVKSMCELKKAIIGYLFEHVERKPYDQWWKYKGKFSYDGQKFDLEAECKWDGTMFTYRHLYISREQQILTVEDVLSKDMIGEAMKVNALH